MCKGPGMGPGVRRGMGQSTVSSLRRFLWTVLFGTGWLSLLHGEWQGGVHSPPVPLPGTGLWAGQLVLYALLRLCSSLQHKNGYSEHILAAKKKSENVSNRVGTREAVGGSSPSLSCPVCKMGTSPNQCPSGAEGPKAG